MYLHHVKPADEQPTPHDKQGALATTHKAENDKVNPKTTTNPPCPAQTGYRYKESFMHCQIRNCIELVIHWGLKEQY